MRALLLTLSACAVLTTGCSTFTHQPAINAEEIQTVRLTSTFSNNRLESDIYTEALNQTQKKLQAKGYTVVTDDSAQKAAVDAVLIARIDNLKNQYAVLGNYTKLHMHYELYEPDGKKIFEKTYTSDALPNSQLDDWKIALVTDLVTSAYRQAKPPISQIVDEITDDLVADFPKK